MDMQLIRAYCVEDLVGILRAGNWTSTPEGRAEKLLILLEKHKKGERHLKPRQYAAAQCLLSVELLSLPFLADPTVPEFTKEVALEFSWEQLREKLQAYVPHLPPNEAAPLMLLSTQLRQTAPATDTTTPAPAMTDEIAFDMVATRQQLIDAFGTFTGMSMEWFNNLNTSPRLKAARKYTGQGGRHTAEPLFCPYEVMQWLADPKRKKGRNLSNEKAWQLLKAHFPKAYTPNSIGDPNDD